MDNLILLRELVKKFDIKANFYIYKKKAIVCNIQTENRTDEWFILYPIIVLLMINQSPENVREYMESTDYKEYIEAL